MAREIEPNTNPVTKENRLLALRLSLSYAMIRMQRAGYDALLYHSINYQQLPAYKDDAALNEVDLNKSDPEVARGRVLAWIDRVESDIAAAIRRKQMRPVH